MNDFIETFLETKFGSFKFRVYKDETVVLWQKPFDQKAPLVRIHSECFTGDILGSYKCDCGPQLEKALKLISQNGGVIIYLRQEGRGIGLFEKIKAYQLQREGFDTFEANVMLGHPPDGRTYESALRALHDLGIDKIRLMTNNPSKVSELSKLGITVLERIPCLVAPNEHNENYLKTKKMKFQHQLSKQTSKYSYQVHVETEEQVLQLHNWLQGKVFDPLLTIKIGINLNDQNLQEKKADIQAISKACKKAGFISVLHVSFKGVSNVSETVLSIHNQYPYIEHIHMNDLSKIDPNDIQKAAKYFQIDLPLADDQMHCIEDSSFQKVIKDNNIEIYLDNSKGRGLETPQDDFKSKIEKLFSLGFSKVGLCGGFGPDRLMTFFALKRFYKVNFSIDAETYLKTDDCLDIKKAKKYLFQLICFENPKEQEVQHAKDCLIQSREKRKQQQSVVIHDKTFYVDENVFHPGFFPSTSWFSQKLLAKITGKCHFCEVGCGSGVISCLVAMSDEKNIQVSATDISKPASQNTAKNAKKFHLNNLTVYQGDVLDGIQSSSQFDYIFWALPFVFLDPGTPINLEETQVFDPGYRAISKFFETANLYLKPSGKILLGFSKKLGQQKLLYTLAKQNNIQLKQTDSVNLDEEGLVDFEILEGVYS